MFHWIDTSQIQLCLCYEHSFRKICGKLVIVIYWQTHIFTLQPIHHDVTSRKNHSLAIAFIWIRIMLYLGLICFYGLLLFNQYKILILYSETLMSLKQFKDTHIKNMKWKLCHIVNQNISNYTQVYISPCTKIQNIYFYNLDIFLFVIIRI